MSSTRRCPTCGAVTRDDDCPGCGTHLGGGAHDVPTYRLAVLGDLLRDLIRFDAAEHLVLARHLLRWTVIGSVIGVLAGASSSVFLFGLKLATDTRLDTPGLLFALPLGGLAVGLAYHHLGGRSAAGNNLILDEIHGLGAPIEGHPEDAEVTAGQAGPMERRAWVPRRLAPLVLLGTWVTHLFGGSAGREGTAIQMSGSLADWFARIARLDGADRRIVLIAAISGGFGSVFGVPLAGAVFGLEVQSVGRIRYDAIVPALAASVVGNVVFDLLDLAHDVTPTVELGAIDLSLSLLAKIVVAALVFGLVSVVFSELTDGIRRAMAVLFAYSPLRPFVGGLAVVGLTFLVGTRDHLGLSLPLIEDALTGADLVWYAFALKLLFTAVTLGSGFQGGEVTPLFVIGATLGAALAGPLDAPVELVAAVGFIAVFAAATNTPLACTIMGIELFGAGALPYLALGCVVAYVFSAHRGIYGAQRIGTPKNPLSARAEGEALRDLHSRRRRRGGADGHT